MKKETSGSSSKGESPSRLIDARIQELDDWRGDMLSRLRALIKQAAPAVVEETVDGVREMRRLREIAEGLDELRPVRDQDGLVQRSLGGLAEEPDRVGAHRLDGLASAIDLFDINAR